MTYATDDELEGWRDVGQSLIDGFHDGWDLESVGEGIVASVDEVRMLRNLAVVQHHVARKGGPANYDERLNAPLRECLDAALDGQTVVDQ